MLRSRPLLGLLLGFSVSVLVASPGCLRTLDASRIGQHNSSGGAAGNDGSAGTAGSDAAGGSDAQVDAGGSAGTDGAAGNEAGADAPVDARPEAGFTAYDSKKHPVTTLAKQSSRQLVSVDNTTVFYTSYDNLKANLYSIPLDLSQGATPVTSGTLSRPQDLVSPSNAISLYYAGATQTGVGVLGRFLKSDDGGANLEQPITLSSGFGRTMGLFVGSDNYVYVSTLASGSGDPALLRFSLAVNTTAAVVVLASASGGDSGGPITMSGGCVYWISNGGVWEVPSSGTAAKANPALENQIKDAVDIASDSSNIYYTRGDGEVWQRALSSKTCDGSGPAEKAIAWGYQNIGHVGVYGTTVVWSAEGDATNSYSGGGIFTTAVGGYDVVQIAPPDDGVDDMAIAPNDVVYSTQNGFVRKVPK